MRYPLPWFPLSEDLSRYSCQTTRGCRPYRSFHAGCRFGRSGSSRSAECLSETSLAFAFSRALLIRLPKVVGVGPSLFRAVFFEYFQFN